MDERVSGWNCFGRRLGDGNKRCVSKDARNLPPNEPAFLCGDVARTGRIKLAPMRELGVLRVTENGIVFTFKGPVRENASCTRPFSVAFLRGEDVASESIRRCSCLVKCDCSLFSLPFKFARSNVSVLNRFSEPQGH